MWLFHIPSRLTADSSARPWPGRRSEQWKELGFQGSDPLTDFRAMGLLAVHCLVYMGENHPAETARLVRAQADGRDYPLCAAVINVVSVLTELLGFRDGEHTCDQYTCTFAPTHAISPTSFAPGRQGCGKFVRA